MYLHAVFCNAAIGLGMIGVGSAVGSEHQVIHPEEFTAEHHPAWVDQKIEQSQEDWTKQFHEDVPTLVQDASGEQRKLLKKIEQGIWPFLLEKSKLLVAKHTEEGSKKGVELILIRKTLQTLQDEHGKFVQEVMQDEKFRHKTDSTERLEEDAIRNAAVDIGVAWLRKELKSWRTSHGTYHGKDEDVSNFNVKVPESMHQMYEQGAKQKHQLSFFDVQPGRERDSGSPRKSHSFFGSGSHEPPNSPYPRIDFGVSGRRSRSQSPVQEQRQDGSPRGQFFPNL